MRKPIDTQAGRSGKSRDISVKPDIQEAREAFARIVREHQKSVFAVAYGKLGNSHDAEDVKQEVFMDAWRNIDKFRKPEGISGWLFKATVNRCRDHFRKKSRRARREEIFNETAETSSSNPSLEAHEDSIMILETISGLPEKIRTVMMLKHMAGLSYAEISRMTGLSKTTIDGRLRIGKKKLRQKLIKLGIGVD
jgi:RNA polymerase sigma-70 factor (ECF subfamily)